MKITVERLREVLDYDKDSGAFTWREKPNRRICLGAVAGTPTNGRLKIKVDEVIYLAHRLAWLHATGRPPTHVIDHINGDAMDNRLCNLRDVPQRINTQNRKTAQSNSKSGVLGVSLCKKTGRWAASLRHMGKTLYLGRHDTQAEAHSAYLRAKRAIHTGNTL